MWESSALDESVGQNGADHKQTCKAQRVIYWKGEVYNISKENAYATTVLFTTPPYCSTNTVG